MQVTIVESQNVAHKTALINSFNSRDLLKLVAANGWDRKERRHPVTIGVIGWDVFSETGEQVGTIFKNSPDTLGVWARLNGGHWTLLTGWQGLEVKPHEIA